MIPMSLLLDRPWHRALDALTRTIGAPMSIKGLTELSQRIHGRAHYSSMNGAVHELLERGLLRELPTAQRSLSLDFRHPELPDLLAETELRRKRRWLEEHPALRPALAAAEDACDDPGIEAALLVEPERNAKLNRLEVLTLGAEPTWAWLRAQHEAWTGIAGRHALRLDTLHLTWDEFSRHLASPEANPVRPMLDDKVVLKSPGGFWRRLARQVNQGRAVAPPQPAVAPRRLAMPALWSNLNRLGYRAFGPHHAHEAPVSAETLVVALLAHDEPRWRAAAAVILAKNPAHPQVLAFLAAKHGQAEALLGVLEAMPPPRPAHVEAAASLLALRGATPGPTDAAHVAETLRRYGH